MNQPHEMLPPGTQVFHGAQRRAWTQEQEDALRGVS